MNDLDVRILEAIRAKPGLKSKEIAMRLGIERATINDILNDGLKGKVYQDKEYRWYSRNFSGTVYGPGMEPKLLNTDLARLCRYYTDCLGYDDLGGISVYASSSPEHLNYVELDYLPMFDDTDKQPFDNTAGQVLLNKIRKDRHRQTAFLGYPVRLSIAKGKSGRESFKVEPVLLFSFKDLDNKLNDPILSEELPHVNFKALQSLSNDTGLGLMQEAIILADELGLNNPATEQPEWDEMLVRLREIRPEWDWKEDLDIKKLSHGAPLSSINQAGIYNRCVIMIAERSPYTKGLESELGQLQSVEESKYRLTALGHFLNKQKVAAADIGQEPLIEVLPLNSEQRQAVRQALSNPLTVITGPPGTGKSQVVTSILINAAWQGKSVLFASKNNKAVDVVEQRVNALGPRPVLLRLGANEYQSRLSEYLISLLAATTTSDDRSKYFEVEAIHKGLQERSNAIDTEFQNLIGLRNTVDQLDQRVEALRTSVGTELFRKLNEVNTEHMKEQCVSLLSYIDMACESKQGTLVQYGWPLLKGKRYKALMDKSGSIQNNFPQLGVPAPLRKPESSSMGEWVEYGLDLQARVMDVLAIKEYFSKLRELSQYSPIGDLNRQRVRIISEIASNSEALWKSWLSLQAERLRPDQRKLLGAYSALLQIIVDSNAHSRQVSGDIYRRYYQLFPQIAAILCCWAVTSLSARSRIPFESNFFDLLVIDEASQCDIASALPLLYRAKRVTIIGDPKQLRHISALSQYQDQQLLIKHKLVKDYAGWDYSTRSLFDLSSSVCRSEDIVALRDHHRSHEDIIEFSNRTFYEGRLRVATKYDRLRSPNPNEPVVRWVNVTGKTVRPNGGGALNEEEAYAVVSEMERLVKMNYKGSIGAVTPFRAQANLIRELVTNNELLSSRLADMDFIADVVHKFQADERDVIIFSPAVSTGISEGALYFLKKTPNLFNVAITRARAQLIIVGNKTAALKSGVDYLSSFVMYVDNLSRKPKVANQSDVDLGPQYPPVTNPELVSEWEPPFYKALYAAGIRSIPQYAIEKYILDFAIIKGEHKLNIEIDGEMFHRNWNGELCRRDQIRNQRLMELGWDVVRFWVYQCRDDMQGCINRVQEWCILHS